MIGRYADNYMKLHVSSIVYALIVTPYLFLTTFSKVSSRIFLPV
jgi:hypothetical protein